MTDEGREVVANMIGPGVPPGEARRLHDRLVAAVRAEERARADEACERCDDLENAVRECFPEMTGDADGNPETNEVCRIESAGAFANECIARAEKAEAALAAAVAERDAWRIVDDLDNPTGFYSNAYNEARSKARRLRAEQEGR